MQVCGGPALTLFRPEELELLVCGLPHLDFEDLHSAARYDGGYNQEHPTVKAFWDVLSSFTLAEKKLFLKFTTGCDRWEPLPRFLVRSIGFTVHLKICFRGCVQGWRTSCLLGGYDCVYLTGAGSAWPCSQLWYIEGSVREWSTGIVRRGS